MMPFLKVKMLTETGNSSMFLIPSVALAPSIVTGIIANFILEETYSLECDIAYSSICDLYLENGVCCITISSHDEWYTFAPKVASMMAASWGIVKLVTTFLISYSGEVRGTIDQ